MLWAADQRIAGVVLDDSDKPVARASIYSYGNRQPNLNGQTDAKGQFTMDKVCTGPIQLSANSRGGGYANVTAEGGDLDELDAKVKAVAKWAQRWRSSLPVEILASLACIEVEMAGQLLHNCR